MGKYQIVAFALSLHTLFWGLGAAWWAMPRRWQRGWPVLAPVLGWALQSAVVWGGAGAGWAGTDRYALASEGWPLLLLLAAAWRSRGDLFRAVGRLWAVWLVAAVCLAALTWPLGRASHALTTASLGSCDAADYAAGARVLQEFAAADRTGFLGHAEVVRVHTTDNFFDYWIRLNHFTPSALVAHHGAILGCRPHEITGLVTVTLLALSVPLVFWLARAWLRFGPGASLLVAAWYACSPLLWYAVYQVSPAQLLAAQAVGLLTWSGAVWWRQVAGAAGARGGAAGGGRETRWRAALAWAAVLAAAYWLILGAYNFVLTVCLGPVVGWTLWAAWRRRAGRAWLWWWGGMLVPLAGVAVVAWPRVAGLIERFRLLREYDFGWKIPVLTPEGWWGLVAGAGLEPGPLGVRLVAGTLLVALLVLALGRAVQRCRALGMWMAVVLLPVAAGYGYLAGRGAVLGTNASYDAYKWLCLFYPLVLPVLALAVLPHRALAAGRPRLGWRGLGVAGLLVVWGNGWGAAQIAGRMTQPPLIVDRALREVAAIERMPQVQSVNLRIEDFWERLWANALLLRRPQYFPTHTYEARRDTPLRGQWDLEAGLVRVRPPDPAERIEVNARYVLVRADSAYGLRPRWAEGWYAEERDPAGGGRWRWTSGAAAIEIENPHAQPVRCVVRVEARSLEPRPWQATLDGGPAVTRSVGSERTCLDWGEWQLPPGRHRFGFRSLAPVAAPGAGDARPLGLQLFGLEIAVRP